MVGLGAMLAAGVAAGGEGSAERARGLVEALKGNPGDVGTMVKLADVLVSGGRLEGAGKLLGRAEAVGTGEWAGEAEALRAECAARAEGAGRAELEEALSAAVALGEAGALAESVARLRLGDPDGALEAAKRAAEAVAAAGDEVWEDRAGRVADQLEECARVARLFGLVE